MKIRTNVGFFYLYSRSSEMVRRINHPFLASRNVTPDSKTISSVRHTYDSPARDRLPYMYMHGCARVYVRTRSHILILEHTDNVKLRTVRTLRREEGGRVKRGGKSVLKE